MSWCRSPCKCCVLRCFRHHPERFLGLALGPCFVVRLIASTFSIALRVPTTHWTLLDATELGCQDTWCTPPRCSSDLQRACSGSLGAILGRIGWYVCRMPRYHMTQSWTCSTVCTFYPPLRYHIWFTTCDKSIRYVRSLGLRRNINIIFHKIEISFGRNIDCTIYQSEHMPTNVSALSSLSSTRPVFQCYKKTCCMIYISLVVLSNKIKIDQETIKS